MSRAILVILPHNPGDVIMALQAIRRVKAAFPGIEVDYLVGEECRDLVQGSPLLRRVAVIPKRALKESWNARDPAALMGRLEGFLGDLASVHYALSANLFQERSGGLIQAFVHADRKIGLEFIDNRNFQVKSRFLEHLFAIPADRSGNAWHVVDIYARAISRALEAQTGIPAAAAAQGRRAENAISLLPPLLRPDAAKPLVPGEYLVFHPGSAWPGKRWPESRWADLASRCARAGLIVAFTGAPEERPLMDAILSRMEAGTRASAVDCVGATTLAGAAWICAHARMVVTGDTVAMHLAAASGAPTLSLFGASNPVETGPYGKGHVIVQTDANPPPDLAFDVEHAGLSHLRSGEIAEYLLDGIPPAGFALWETGWDETGRMQVLRDRTRSPHPALERSAGLLRFLDRHADRPPPEASPPAPGADGPRDNLHRLLSTCIADPRAGNLASLEAAEREWAEESRADLVWEAYRIAMNGLPLGDIGSHLALRLARFESALREESQANAHSGR